MRKRAEVRSPDGERWVVSRQWVKGPKIRWGVRRKPHPDDLRHLDISLFDFVDSPSGIALTLAFVVATGIVIGLTAFVLLPLLGIAIELMIALALLGYGIAGRVLFRRPWVIEAWNLDNPLRSRNFKVVGWQRSREAIPGVEQLIVSGADLDSPSAQALGAE